MLLLDVTDGHTTAQVMEYQHIDQIDCNVKPGTKVCITIWGSLKSLSIIGNFRSIHMYKEINHVLY